MAKEASLAAVHSLLVLLSVLYASIQGNNHFVGHSFSLQILASRSLDTITQNSKHQLDPNANNYSAQETYRVSRSSSLTYQILVAKPKSSSTRSRKCVILAISNKQWQLCWTRHQRCAIGYAIHPPATPLR